jgi:hypothetical protein
LHGNKIIANITNNLRQLQIKSRTLQQRGRFLHQNNLYTWQWPIRMKHIVI